MDLTFTTAEGKFNVRVVAVIVKDEKLLCTYHADRNEYTLPGGRLRFAETAEDGVLRETKEEMGISAKIVRPLWVVQNFFTEKNSGIRRHEFNFYYLLDITETSLLQAPDRFFTEDEGSLHEFVFLPFAELKNVRIHPAFLPDCIYDLPQTPILLSTVRE